MAIRPLPDYAVALRADTAWWRRLAAAGTAAFTLKGLAWLAAGYWLLER